MDKKLFSKDTVPFHTYKTHSDEIFINTEIFQAINILYNN